MKKGFFTEYAVNSSSFASYVVANNINEANALCNKRGIGEIVVSNECIIEKTIFTDEEIEKSSLIELLHPICFLMFIGEKSNILTVDETLGDEGILHEVIHEINSDNSEKINALKVRVKALIRMIPGVY